MRMLGGVSPRQVIQLGPSGRNVAANVQARRHALGLTFREMSEQLEKLGQPIRQSGLVDIEASRRRVDADDLVALALVLRTTPNRLLGNPNVPVILREPEVEDRPEDPVDVTPNLAAPWIEVWAWFYGEALPPVPVEATGAYWLWPAGVRPDAQHWDDADRRQLWWDETLAAFADDAAAASTPDR